MKDKLNAIAKLHEEYEMKREKEKAKRSRKKIVDDMQKDVESAAHEQAEKASGEKE